MFRDREDAAYRLAERLKGRELHGPLVLAIPRGGVVIGAVLAEELGAELDVVLSRKLRAPGQPELAVGAITEDGGVYLDPYALEYVHLPDDYLAKERHHQLAEIARRKKLFRAVRPPARVPGRSVILTDDGIATGSTILAAIQTVQAQNPRELIVAVPVASQDRLDDVRRLCNDVVCLLSPKELWAVGQFYQDFCEVDDEQVVDLLRKTAYAHGPADLLGVP
jgi:predicted phosphoribosyltransferase